MKSIIRLIEYILPCCLFFMSCEDQNSVNQEYIDRGESIYTGMIDSAIAYPGNNRVKLEWWINADPRITKTVIYRNDDSDSIVAPVNRTQSGSIKMETMIDIPEGSYIFEFVTKDNAGHRSLGYEETVEIYGNTYISFLQNRDTASVTVSKITWAAITSPEIQYTTVRYADYTDPDHPVPRTVRVENADTETSLYGAKSGEELSVTTSYLPANGLDIVDALPKIYTLP